MATASPLFSFSGVATPLAKKTVAATTSFTATLDDLTGVNTVAWSIVATDETTVPGNYTLTPSGSKGSVVTITSLALGTAALLSCTINGGIDPVTSKPSSTMTATALFEVLLLNGGSVGVVGETTQRDAVFGSLIYLNDIARKTDAVTTVLGTPVVAPTPNTVPLRGSAGELKGVRFETGTGSAQSGTVRLPDGASIMVRTSDALADANVISASAGVISLGDILHAAWLKFFSEAGGKFTYTNGTTVVLEMNGTGISLIGVPDLGGGDGVVGIGKATTDPTTNPVHGFILYVDSATGTLKARGSSGTVTTLALP